MRDPRVRRTSLEGGGDPRARRTLLQGGASPRARWTSSRGFEPSSEADLARGGALLGRFGGARGRHDVDRVVCFVLGPRLGLRFAFFCRF
jgi:hypothetical protein